MLSPVRQPSMRMQSASRELPINSRAAPPEQPQSTNPLSLRTMNVRKFVLWALQSESVSLLGSCERVSACEEINKAWPIPPMHRLLCAPVQRKRSGCMSCTTHHVSVRVKRLNVWGRMGMSARRTGGVTVGSSVCH
jgi:hypothetical protein